MSDTPDNRAPEQPAPGGDARAIAALVHELNNVVGGILIAAQHAASVIERDVAGPAVTKALADIEADAERCRDLVRSLRELCADLPDP